MNENEFIIQIKKHWPNSMVFFTIFVTFKAIGLFMISYSVNQEKMQGKDSTMIKYFKTISFIPDIKQNYNHFNINLLFLVIYSYLLTIVAIYIYLKLSIHPAKSTDLLISKDKSSKKKLYRVISIFTFWLTIYTFSSQYFLEILSLPICIKLTKWISKDKIKPIVWDNLSIIAGEWYIPIYIALIINLIFIVLTNYVWYHYIKLWNNIIISTKKIITFIPNNKIILMFTLLHNFQMFHYYGDILLDENSMLIILHISCIAYCLVFQVWLNKYISNTKFCNILFYIVSINGVISSVFSWIINFTVNITLKITYFKWIASWIFTALILVVLVNRKKQYLYRIFPSIWFKRQRVQHDFMTEVIFWLNHCLRDSSILSDFVVIIQNHKRICGSTECDCHEIDFDEWCRDFKFANGGKFAGLSKNRNKFYSILIWIENELQNLIMTAYKLKRTNSLMYLVIIHCCFMTYFKDNHLFSIYLLEQYLSRFQDMALEYKASILYHKNMVLKRYFEEQHSKLQCEMFSKGEGFIQFVSETQLWKKKMKKFMNHFSKVLNIKQTYVEIANKKQINFNEKTNSTQIWFKHCSKMELAVDEISVILKKNFKKKPLKNLEICYLLTHFYDIYQGNIPSELRGIFKNIKIYNVIKQEESLYLEQKFTHPLIFNLSTNVNEWNTFNILYCSDKWLRLLHYTPSEVINQSINTLLPPLFAQEHSLIIQKTTLWENNEKMKKESMFLWTKDSYYVKASFTMSNYPSLSSGVLFIWDVKPVLDDISSKWNKYNSYVFITDKHTNIISMSESFAKKYLLSLHIIKSLNIPFTGIFGINRDKLLKHFEEYIKGIELLNLNLIGKVSNIWQDVKWKEMKLVYKDLKTETTKSGYFSSKPITFKENNALYKKSKKQWLNSIHTIRKEIQEKEYENEFIDKLRYFENKIMYDLDNDTFFNFCVKCQSMGNIPYFIITLDEIKDKVNPLDSPLNFSRSILNPIITFSPTSNWDKMQNSGKATKSMKRVVNFIPCKMEIPQIKVSTGNRRESSLEISSPSFKFDSTNRNWLWSQEVGEKLKKANNWHLIEMNFERDVNNISIIPSPRGKRDMIISIPSLNPGGMSLKNEIQSSQEHISEKQNNNNNKNAFISIGIFLFTSLCVISLLIIITSMFTKSSKITRLQDIDGLNIQTILFKEMLYEISSSILSGCFRTDKFEENPYLGVDFPTDQLTKNMYKTSSKFYNYFMYITDFINKYHYINETNDLFDLVYGQLYVVRLNNKWNYSIINSTYENEINKIHIDSGIFRNNNSAYNCLIEKAFLGARFNNIEIDEEANSDAVRFFYILGNLQKAITDRTDLIIVKANQLQMNYSTITRKDIYVIDISCFILLILMIASFAIVIQAYNIEIKRSIGELSLPVGNINSWERKIGAFVKIISFFDEENWRIFEKRGLTAEKGFETMGITILEGSSLQTFDNNEVVKKKKS